MNIAFVTAHRLWGGVKVWALEFGAALPACGHHMRIYARDPRFVEEARKRGMQAEVVRFGADYNPRAIAWFWRELRRRQVDLVVGNIYKELRTAGVAARLRGIPVVQRVGLVGDLRDTWRHRIVHRAIVAHLLVTSAALREAILAQHAFVAPQRITCVHNGREPYGPPHAARHRPVRFVISARLARAKGHAYLLEALRRVRVGGRADFRLDVYGDGDQREALQRQIDAAGLREQVTLHGFRHDLQACLLEADIGVLASEDESLANVVLEYLAAGLPVVATDVGGVPELVRPGRNGLLYAYGDVEALAAHLAHCMAMPEPEYARLAQESAAILREDFYRPDKVRELAAFFERVVAAGPA